MPRKTRWNDEALAQLRLLAASGKALSELAAAFDAPINSVVSIASFHKITIVRHTEAERAEIKARERARDNAKKLRKRQKRRILEVVARHKAVGLPAVSKTSPAYRNQLAPTGNLTKSQINAMYAEAVRNTARMAV